MGFCIWLTVLRRSDVRSGRPQTQAMTDGRLRKWITIEAKKSTTDITVTGGSPEWFGWGHGRPDRANRRGLDARRRLKNYKLQTIIPITETSPKVPPVGADVFLRQAAATTLNRTITTPTITISLQTLNFKLNMRARCQKTVVKTSAWIYIL